MSWEEINDRMGELDKIGLNQSMTEMVWSSQLWRVPGRKNPGHDGVLWP